MNPPWTGSLTLAAAMDQPHCTPTSPLLASISAALHTCIPTPAALLSTILGSISILCWLFAQLPQVVKNFRLHSASGLSIYFLVEWCLGDMSNLTGAVLTNQATWQVIIAAYYCFVDFMLVGQWLWYERLRHGRPLRSVWLRKYRSWSSFGRKSADGDGDMAEVLEVEADAPDELAEGSSPAAVRSDPRQIRGTPFQDPQYDTSRLSPHHATGILRNSSASLPSPSPRTILFLSCVLALCSRGMAAPTGGDSVDTLAEPGSSAYIAGTAISWASTLLYLGSRLPQIIKNARLRSTAGLSPLLFLAAFLGNSFYSLSMVANPLAWADYPPYGAGGWAPAEGSTQRDWVLNALPFFLGAAGVLVLDASVGLQFWMFREVREGDEEVVVVVESDMQREGRVGKQLRRVSGWMRGWAPGMGAALRRDSWKSDGGERAQLLASNGGAGQASGDYGSRGRKASSTGGI